MGKGADDDSIPAGACARLGARDPVLSRACRAWTTVVAQCPKTTQPHPQTYGTVKRTRPPSTQEGERWACAILALRHSQLAIVHGHKLKGNDSVSVEDAVQVLREIGSIFFVWI